VEESIDWFLGELRYRWVCHRYVPVRVDIDAEGTLDQPPPAWAKRGRVVIVGQVVQAGKKVKLAKAFVADLRAISAPQEGNGTVTEPE
jgi:hypothetical protein